MRRQAFLPAVPVLAQVLLFLQVFVQVLAGVWEQVLVKVQFWALVQEEHPNPCLLWALLWV